MDRLSPQARRYRATAAKKNARQARRDTNPPLMPQPAYSDSDLPELDQVLAATQRDTPPLDISYAADIAEDAVPSQDRGGTATIAAPPLPPEDISGRWRNTWIQSQLDAPDSRSWHWQEPDFDEDLTESWIRRMRRRNSLRHTISRMLPFGLNERATSPLAGLRRHLGILITLAVVVVVAVAGGIVGYRQAVHASDRVDLGAVSAQGGTDSSGIVIVPPSLQQSGTPTPAVPVYQIGVWVSDSSPAAPGTINVYVRIVHGTDPAVGAAVTLSMSSGTIKDNSQKTNADGIATFTVTFGPVASVTPVFVTANAVADTNKLSAQTTLAIHPLGPSGSSSSTPTNGSNN